MMDFVFINIETFCSVTKLVGGVIIEGSLNLGPKAVDGQANRVNFCMTTILKHSSQGFDTQVGK